LTSPIVKQREIEEDDIALQNQFSKNYNKNISENIKRLTTKLQQQQPQKLDKSVLTSVDACLDEPCLDVSDSTTNLLKIKGDVTTAIAYTDGIHCGEDSGLGSSWEANVRMPALIRWTGTIEPGTITNEMVSTIDVVPTILSIIQRYDQRHYQDTKEDGKMPSSVHNKVDKTAINNIQSSDQNEKEQGRATAVLQPIHSNKQTYNQPQQSFGLPYKFDGIDISSIILDDNKKILSSDDLIVYAPTITNATLETRRMLFFWRDGFANGPLEPPFGRYDIVAVKVEPFYKLWFYTKSSHYNPDPHVYHDPPIIFDIHNDPAEAYPLPIDDVLLQLIQSVNVAIQQHKDSIEWTYPLTLDRDPKNIPCANQEVGCRTSNKINGKSTSVF
jgi:C-terminal region of aryl-sulfatase